MQSGKSLGYGIDGTDTESLINLLMIISCFPMGLFLHHYISIVQDGDFKTLLSLPSDYLVPIVLLSRMSPRELQNPNLDISDKEPAIVDHLMMGDEDAASQIVSNLVAYVGSGMYYLSTKYDKEDVLLMSHHGIRNHIRELGMNKEQLYTAFFVAFACYQNLFTKMIKIAKQECYVYEELVEYNSLCPSPAWDFTFEMGGESDPIDQEYGPSETGLDLFLKKQTSSVSGFKQLFTHYDSNLGVLLIDETNFFSIPSMLEYASCCGSEIFIEFVNLLEDTIIKLMTLNRICGEYDRCRDLSRHLLRLTKLEIGKKCLRRTIFKSALQLGCAWLSELQDIHIETKSPEHRQNLAGNIDTLTRNLEDLTQEKEYDVFACAVLTLQLKSSILLSNFLIYTPQQQAVMMQNLFRHAEKLFKMDNGSGYSDYEHDWAKACLALIQCGFTFEEQNPMASDLPNTKQGILNRIEETFKVHNSPKLRCLALEILCLDHLQLNQYKDVLDVAQRGIEVSTEFALNTIEGRFRDIFSKAESELRSQYENKFMFLIADPIIPPPEQPAAESPAGLSKTTSTRPLAKEWSPAKLAYIPGPEVMEKKVSFRKAILTESFLKSLKSLGKKIAFHFDACTRNMLDLLYDKTEGAKVLVLHVEHVTEEYLIAEGSDFGCEKITFEEMQQKNQNPEFSLGVDVLILTGPRGELLARYFRDSNVKYIVYFEIPERKSQAFLDENQYDFLTTYWVEKFKEEFISRFFERYSTGLDASASLKQAKIRAVERITHMMTDESSILHKVELSSFKPSSATPIEIELDFEFNQNMIVIEECATPGESVCRLTLGNWFDCSPDPWKLKDRFDIPEIYIRRDHDILSIYDKLQKYERIQLTGDRGCGKSFVATLLLKELSLRNVYPDGVFYVDIGNVKITNKDDNSLYPYLREVFHEDILNSDSFLANKRILLILDGYQRVVDREIVKPTYLIECIMKYHTHAIFMTPKESFVPEAKQNHNVQPFTPEESLACMLSLGIDNSKFFFRLNSFSVEKLIRSDTMKEVIGSPLAIQAKAARFYDRELGVIWKKVSKLNINSSGSVQNMPNILESWDSMRNLDDFDEKSEFSLLLNQTISGTHVNTSSGSNKASEKKGKKSDSKKDEKNPKQRKKVKDKKSMC